MPKIDIASVKVEVSTGYPEPYRSVVAGRSRQRLGNVVGLDQFGVNLTRLKPGVQSALRHWHAAEDEFVFVVEGTLVLCENDGETVLTAGEAAGFKAGGAHRHWLVHLSAQAALYREIAPRCGREQGDYPDIDLRFEKDESGAPYTQKPGEPYPR